MSATEIHVIFDRYLWPSIKNRERKDQGGIDVAYPIVGPKQTRSNDSLKSLRNKKFKKAVILFLSKFWADDSKVGILGSKKVFLTLEEKCFSYQVQRGCVIITEGTKLQCFHEEADTRMIFHIYKSKPDSTIMVKATDTDVFILLLSHMRNFPNLKVWMSGTVGRKQDQECVDCTTLAETLGPLLCSASIGFHVFTGCDYTSFLPRG